MSQPKTLTNVEKAKLLREIRKRLGLTQQQMGERLNLDSTYISQLEGGKRPVDDFYVKRANEIEAELEKSNSVKSPGWHSGEVATRESCRSYFEEFLQTCDTPSKLGWTAMELLARFPLNKWDLEAPLRKPSSASLSEDVERALRGAPAALKIARESEQQQNTGAPSGNKRGRGSGSGGDSGR